MPPIRLSSRHSFIHFWFLRPFAFLGVVCFLIALCVTLPSPAQQVVTIAPSSGVAPTEVYSGTNYSGIHSNGVSISSALGLDQIDLQVTNLPAGVTVYLQSSILPSVTNPTTFNLPFGIAVTNVAQGDYTLYLVASSTNSSIAV